MRLKKCNLFSENLITLASVRFLVNRLRKFAFYSKSNNSWYILCRNGEYRRISKHSLFQVIEATLQQAELVKFELTTIGQELGIDSGKRQSLIPKGYALTIDRLAAIAYSLQKFLTQPHRVRTFTVSEQVILAA